MKIQSRQVAIRSTRLMTWVSCIVYASCVVARYEMCLTFNNFPTAVLNLMNGTETHSSISLSQLGKSRWHTIRKSTSKFGAGSPENLA